MPILLTDPEREEELRAERSSSDGDKWNEVWDGLLVISPELARMLDLDVNTWQ